MQRIRSHPESQAYFVALMSRTLVIGPEGAGE